MTAASVAERFGAKASGSGWKARCPAHDDRVQSLSIREGDQGRTLLKCFAGCETAAIVEKAGLTMADLFPANPTRLPAKKIATRGKETVYQVRDGAGALVAEHVRQDLPGGSKKFFWRRDGKNSLGGLPVADLPLYGSELVKGWPPDAPLFLCEGEKAALALRQRGATLGTTCGAAATPSLASLEVLRGREVFLWPDNDDAGRAHMDRIATRLSGIASRVRVIAWGEKEKDDAADFFARGDGEQQFQEVLAASTEWKPPEVRPIGETLDSIAALVRRYVVMSPAQVTIAALWIVHTHAIDAADVTAFLAVTSAEKRSGKTRLLEVLELLVRAPMRAANLSVAVLFRAIEELHPTVLFDEVDGIFGPKAKGNEELRALLNAGHSRGSDSFRMGGARMTEFQKFETFGARVLAAIGELPDTIADRSILIRMQRRAKTETVERFRRREAKLAGEPLRQKVAAWAEANLGTLRNARPIFPAGLSDRTEDGAEPLLAIADRAGGEWPERARHALVELCAGAEAAEDSVGLRLLRSIQSIFAESRTDRFSSAVLCDRLNALEEAAWSGWNEGKGIKPRNLSKLLKPYGVESRNVRLDDGGQAKGYDLDQFEGAFSRYMAPVHDSERPTVPDPATIERNPISSSVPGSCWDGSTNTVSTNIGTPWDGGTDESSLPERSAACSYFIGKIWSGSCGRCGAPSGSHESPDFEGFGVS